MKLDQIAVGQTLSGVEVSQNVTVIATIQLSDSLQLIYRTPEGQIKERLLGQNDEPEINIAISERPFSFDGVKS